MNKQITAIALGLSLLSGSAFAQTSVQSDKTPSTAAHKQGQWRSSKVIGVNIYNEANDKIGEVDDIILDKSGKVDNVVLSVGGFLGIGEHRVAVPMEKIKWVNEPARTTAAATSAGAPATNAESNARSSGNDSRSTTGSAYAAQAANDRWYPDHGVYNATRDQLKALPEFKY